MAVGPTLGVNVGRGVAVADAVAVGWLLAWRSLSEKPIPRSRISSAAISLS